MKLSRSAMRKLRRKKKAAAVTSINLVSMIDIFTILIIYLLVNTAAVQIAGAEQVDMPKARTNEPPRETVAVIVNAVDVLVDGKPVMKVSEIPVDGPAILPALKDRLLSTSPPTASQAQNTEDAGEVNILADKSISYALLKKIMATCADARFAKISLGVIPVGKNG